MSIYFLQWLTLIAVYTLAAISPGPNFVVSVRNSLVYSRRVGVFTALGFGLAMLVHAAYTVAGFAVLISQSIFLFNVIKFAGAVYLVYLGILALRSRGVSQQVMEHSLDEQKQSGTMGDVAALRCGFLTSVLNPKATLFFLAVFSQIIGHDTPLIWNCIYGATCAVIEFAWFSFVAFVLTQGRVRGVFLKAGKWLDRTCGALMIGLGIKVALTTK